MGYETFKKNRKGSLFFHKTHSIIPRVMFAIVHQLIVGNALFNQDL